MHAPKSQGISNQNTTQCVSTMPRANLLFFNTLLKPAPHFENSPLNVSSSPVSFIVP
jgi:hypothetical protein